MSRNLRWTVVLAVVALLALALASAAIAAKGGNKPPNPGGGGGGNKPPSEATNSLSVPAIMVANVFTGVNAPPDLPSPLVAPTGTPSTDWEINPLAYYYVQRVNGPWQAQAYTCTGTATRTGTAQWGDNLVGDASLKIGSPIRVELGLFADSTTETMLGYLVDKLEPSKLDRESAYGTLAEEGASAGTWQAIPTTFGVSNSPNLIRIYDSAVTFSIMNVTTGTYSVQPGTPASAEINAKGAIVYGYNLRVGVVGDYDITYTIPNVDITGVDVGTYNSVADGPDTVTVRITVGTKGGGGGGEGE